MPWSTTRNKGPGRHIVRLILLVVLAWGVIYHFTFNQTPDPETLKNLLYSHYYHNGEGQGQGQDLGLTQDQGAPPGSGPVQWRRPSRPMPKTSTNTKADSPQVNIAAKGPQIGQTQVDIGVKKDKDPASPARKEEEPYIPPINIAPPPEPAAAETWEKERYDAPGEPIKHVTLTRNIPHNEPPSLLILMMTRDAHSWGRETEERNFTSFLNLLSGSGLDLKTCALGMLTSSEDEFKTYERELDADREQFGAGFLVLHPGYAGREKGDGEEGRNNRHDDDVQHARRSEMARLRNYLMLTALPQAPTAAEVLWMDADVYEVTEGLFGDMRRGMQDHRVGVVTALSLFGSGSDWTDYDLNAWRGERTTPNEQERAQLRVALGSWTASPVGGKSEHMGNIIPRLDREEWERKVEAGEIAEDSTEVFGQWDPRKLVQERENEKAEEERKRQEAEEARRKKEDEEGGQGEGEGDGENGEGKGQGQNGEGDGQGEDQDGDGEGENEDGDGQGEDQQEEGGDGGNENNDAQGEDNGGDGGEGRDGGEGDGDGQQKQKRKVTKKKNGSSSTKKNSSNSKSTKKKAPKKKKKEHEKVEIEGFFRLDAVGGTVLMLKAGVVRQGLTFATSYLVGTDWQNEGWDGIETEGLCVTARSMGTGCWGIRKGYSRHCVG